MPESDVATAGEDGFLARQPLRAQRLLLAGRRLLIEQGYDALTLDAVSKAAGEYKSTIRYYFGDKSGFILALLKLLAQDATEGLVRSSQALPRGSSRIHAHVTGTRALTTRPEFLAFFDVLPHALRDPAMRNHIAELYHWYREMNVTCFGVEASESNREALLDIASLFIAAADGIAVQAALDPEHFDAERVFARLEAALALQLDGLAG